MKRNVLGWLVVVALSGCGLDAGSNRSSSNGLSAADAGDEKGTAGGWGGPAGCAVACEAEQIAYKECTVTGAPCNAELSTMNTCLGAQPPAQPDPCLTLAIAFKTCSGTAANQAACASEQSALDACWAAQPPPPVVDPNTGTGGCNAGPANDDVCQPILVLFKDCTTNKPTADCSPLLQGYDACESAQKSAPVPDKP